MSNTTNRYLQYAIIAGLVLILFIPLVISTNFFFPFITGKNFAFRILVEIVFGLWLILALRDPEFRPRFSWLAGAFGVFLLVMAVADAFSPNVLKSFFSNFERMEGYVTLAHLAAYFLVASSVLNSERRWTRFFFVSLLTSLVIGVYGMFQLAGLLPINQGGVRLDGTLGNAAYLAAYMLLSFFIALFLLVRSLRQRPESIRNMAVTIAAPVAVSVFFVWLFTSLLHPFHLLQSLGYAPPSGQTVLWVTLLPWVLVIAGIAWWRKRSVAPVILSALAVLQLFIVYRTETRGAMLGLLGGFFVGALLWAWLSKKKAARTAGLVGVGAILAVVLLGALLKNTAFVRDNSALVRLTSISAQDAGPRFMVWNMAVKGFLQDPKTMLIGWGQESFNYVFNEYYDPGMYAQEQWFDRAHDIVFDWLVAGGALGLLAYLSLFYLVLYYIWKQGEEGFTMRKCLGRLFSFKQREEVPYLLEKCILTGLLLAYFFQNLFVFDNITSYLLFFTLLAYVHSISAWPVKRLTERRLLDAKTTNYIAAPVIVVAIGCLIYFINVIPMRASAELIDALKPQSAGLSANLAYFNQALADGHLIGDPEVREQLTQSALQVIYDQSASLQIKQQYYDLAYRELQKQVQETPQDARYFLFLGSFLNRARNYDAAIPILQKAVSLSPDKQTIMFELGSAYLNKGDNKDALATLKKAFDLETDFSEARIIYAVAEIYAKDYAAAKTLMAPLASTTSAYDPRIIQAYDQAKQYQTEIDLLQKDVNVNPTDPQARFSLAAAYLSAGDRQQSINVLTYVSNNFPSQKQQADYYIQEIKAGRNP